MQILIFSLLIIALVVYVIYKVKKTFTQKEIIGFLSLITALIIGMVYFNTIEENRLADSFKAHYLKEKNLDILKLSYNQTNIEVLNSSKQIFDFIYIIKKDDKEYVCEAKDVETQQIEDEYVFKKYKEECRLK